MNVENPEKPTELTTHLYLRTHSNTQRESERTSERERERETYWKTEAGKTVKEKALYMVNNNSNNKTVLYRFFPSLLQMLKGKKIAVKNWRHTMSAAAITTTKHRNQPQQQDAREKKAIEW